MPNSGKRCANCTNRGRKCVDVSWESLDRVRTKEKAALEKDFAEWEDVREKLDLVQKKLNEVMNRISMRRKIVAQADTRAKAKTICLMEELEAEEEIERAKNGGLSELEMATAMSELALGVGPEDWVPLDSADGIFSA